MQVAIREPVGDHPSDRMFGTRRDGFADVDSENKTGFTDLKTFGNASFFNGLDRIGAICEDDESKLASSDLCYSSNTPRIARG